MTLKTTLLRFSNLGLYIACCALAGTGLLLHFQLPPSSRGGRGLTFYGLDRHEWGDIHLWIAYSVIALSILHVALNWQWMVKIAATKKKWKLIGGIAFGLLIIFLFLFLPTENTGRGFRNH